MIQCHCTPHSSDVKKCFPPRTLNFPCFYFSSLCIMYIFTLAFFVQMPCCRHNPHTSSTAAHGLHTAQLKCCISICILCDTLLAFISMYVASMPQRFPAEQISSTVSITEITEREKNKENKTESNKEEAREQKEKESSEKIGEKQLNEFGREPKWASEKERDVEL